MRIGIDVHTIDGFMQGTRTYALNLVENLLEIDEKNEYFLYFTSNGNQIHSAFGRRKNAVLKRIFPSERIIRIPFSFPLKLAVDSIDMFHCQYMGPPFGSTPYIVSMHDIIHEYLPGMFPRALRTMMHVTYAWSARKASRIITLSENSRRDIMNIYKVPAEKIAVIHPGVSSRFGPEERGANPSSISAKYGIDGPYIFYVGRLEPRKNLPNLVRAYSILRATSPKIPHKLIIAGMRYYRHEEIDAAIRECGMQDHVKLPGRIEDADLPSLYRGASLFVYPSLAEGFGLPPLEAMACAVPVICSNTSSLPEVAGDAGVLIDPFDIEGLADAMRRVLTDESLCKSMKEKGLARARKFSWQSTARRVLDLYREVDSYT